MLVDFLCASAGGPLYYVGRDMKISHQGMGIDERDWGIFIGHLQATLIPAHDGVLDQPPAGLGDLLILLLALDELMDRVARPSSRSRWPHRAGTGPAIPGERGLIEARR